MGARNNSPPYQAYLGHGQTSPPAPEYEENYYGHSFLNKTPTQSQQLPSPGLESVMADEGDKEVAFRRWSRPDPMPQTWSQHERQGSSRRSRTVCGLSLSFVCILLAVLVAIGVGLGVGLGIGLNNDDRSASITSGTEAPASPSDLPVDTQFLIGGAIDPSYYSTMGAFNGSGIALASQSFAGAGETATRGSLVMYFQHHSGDIRYMQLSEEGQWLGGSSSETVAVDAKNNTPLSAVSYSVQGVNYWHVFYIDGVNHLRQRSNSNDTNVWSNGTIDAMELEVFDADQIGMQACWYGNNYGDSDYVHTPLPGDDDQDDNTDDTPSAAATTGMHMWFASSTTTFEQYGWRFGDGSWQHQKTWTDKNGHAGVACYSWAATDTSTTYAMFVNAANTVELWWRDTDPTHSAQHPVNEWVNASIAIPDANPASSLGFTNYIYWQDGASGMIMGRNISFAAENSTFVGDAFAVGDVPGISGTHLSVSALPDVGGGNTLTVFFQTEGDDVTEYARDWIAGQWTSVQIAIPGA